MVVRLPRVLGLGLGEEEACKGTRAGKI
jgi:hypothetical protein